jgi:hypothetical protein
MDTKARYFVIDPVDSCILTSTRDHRVAQAVAMGILDSKVESLGDHSKFQTAVKWCQANYEKFETTNIKFSGEFTFLDDSQVSDRYKKSKNLAIARRKFFMFLYMFADTLLNSYFMDTFVNHEAVSVVEKILSDDDMLREYASCADMPIDEARKELEIKLQSRYFSVLKVQGHVDYLIRKVNETSSIKEIIEYYDITKYRMLGNYV